MSGTPGLAAGIARCANLAFDMPSGREMALIAALLADAVDRARRGDASARLWLECCAFRYVQVITPDDADPAVVHRALLAMVTNATSSAWQPGLFDLEVAA